MKVTNRNNLQCQKHDLGPNQNDQSMTAEIDNQRLIVGLQLFHDLQVLEYFELQPDSNVFLELIPIFPKV
jgi:hypothetical protein